MKNNPESGDRPQRSVTFTRPQLDWLEAEAVRQGLSLPELIRRIIDEHRERAEAKKEASGAHRILGG